jgi:hypothetical protein
MRVAISVPEAVGRVLQALPRARRDALLVHAVGSVVATRVMVQDAQGMTLAPCTSARARQLVSRGRARWIARSPAIICLIPSTPSVAD